MMSNKIMKLMIETDIVYNINTLIKNRLPHSEFNREFKDDSSLYSTISNHSDSSTINISRISSPNLKYNVHNKDYIRFADATSSIHNNKLQYSELAQSIYTKLRTSEPSTELIYTTKRFKEDLITYINSKDDHTNIKYNEIFVFSKPSILNIVSNYYYILI